MEKIDLEQFPTSESAQRMLSYVTEGWYDRSYVGKWLYQVMGMEYDKAFQAAEELPMQFFPETATWGLCWHEIKWGLPVQEGLSYEERRRRIYQKRDFQASMTPYRMEQYLERAFGLKVQVTDIHDPGRYGHTFIHPNMFRVQVIGDSSLDPETARAVIDRLKQSHTMYDVELLESLFECPCSTYAAVAVQTKKIFEMEVL